MAESSELLMFLVRLLYRIPAVLIYLSMIREIQRNKKQYSGSFYTLFMASSITNILVFLNATLFLQLTKVTPASTFLGSLYFLIPDYVARIIHTLSYHFAYIQFIMIFYMSLDRFTLLHFPLNHAKIWKHSIYWALIAAYILPLILDFPLLLSASRFMGIENDQKISLQIDRTLVPKIFENLAIFMVVTVVVTLFCNVATIITFTKIKGNMKAAEKKLYILSVYNFLLQALVTVYTYYALNSSENFAKNQSTYFFMVYYFGPFISDLLTFSNPFVLLILMKDMRESIFGCFKHSINSVSQSEEAATEF